MVTRAPRSQKYSALPAPIPEPPPVISTDIPSISLMERVFNLLF